MSSMNCLTPAEAYYAILEHVVSRGIKRSPRGRETLDGGFTVLTIKQPYDRPLPLGIRPNLSTHVAAVEAIQLIGGFAVPELMVAASPRFAEFREPDMEFWGAYGSRVGHQVSNVIDKLTADPDTRQAIITLWDPLRDNVPGKKDYPCTIAIQFEIIKHHVCMTVTMRSNDVWLGLPYDMFQFSQLQQTVANVLKRPVGTYRHVAWSSHLYLENIDAAYTLLETCPRPADTFQPEGLGIGFANYGDVRKLARQLALGLPTVNMREHEAWYADRLNELNRRVSDKARIS